MTVDYTFVRRYVERADVSLASTDARRMYSIIFCPGATTDKDMIAMITNNNSGLMLLQRSGVTGSFDTTQGERFYAASATFGNDVLSIAFIQGNTPADDQLAIVVRDSTDLYFLARDGVTGLFEAGQTPTTISIGPEVSQGVAFCPNSNNYLNDELGLSIGQNFQFNIGFIQRNAATGIFDSGSTVRKITGRSGNQDADTVVFVPNSDDITKDAFFAFNSDGGNGGLYFERNGTGIFDLTIVNADFEGNIFDRRKCTYIQGPTAAQDQLVFYRDGNNSTVTFLTRDSGGGWVDSGYTNYSMPSNGGVTAAFFKHPQNSDLDAVIVGTSLETNYIIIRNPITDVFDGSSELLEIPTSTYATTVADPFYVYAIPGVELEDYEFWISGTSADRTKRFAATEFEAIVTSVVAISYEEQLSKGTRIASILGGLEVKADVSIFELDSHASVASQLDKFSYTRNENTDVAYGGNLKISGAFSITGDFLITLGVSTTLDLSAATLATRTENIALDATSTVVLNGDTLAAINLEAFTFAAGTTIDNAGGADVSVTVASDPGIVTTSNGGGVVNLVAPQLTLTVDNLPTGCEVRIYDLDDTLPDFGTELAGVESLIGTSFNWVHAKAGDDVFLQIFADGFKEYGEAISLLTVSQTINSNGDILEPEDAF